MSRANHRGINLSWNAANTLRRASLTLSRWGELECGDSNDYQSFSLERDEVTERPYMVIRPYDSNKVQRYPVADRESGAIKRVARLCNDSGLFYFHQTDPRGVALYVSNVPLTDQNYSTVGIPCEV
jgi:hypothetical protein